MDRIVIFGESKLEYIAKSNKQLTLQNANAGKISVSYGGVGRNIVENLLRLGNEVTFFTGLGEDVEGQHIDEGLTSLGCEVKSSKAPYPTSSYLAIHNSDGDMELAIVDTRASDNLSISYIKKDDFVVRARDYLVMDTNLSPRLIADLFHTYPDKKWCIEASSINKVDKIVKYFSRIYLFKSSLQEIRKATGLFDKGIEDNALAMLNLGVKKVVITDGINPICLGENGQIKFIKFTTEDNVIDYRGVKEALFAGIIDKINMGKTLEAAVRFGQKLACKSLMSSQAIAEDFSEFKYDHDSK